MAWTPEQLDAIEKSGSNIIVSAGAGSGKTAVLSERVINKLKSGIHVNELLILTFTKAAASEMKDRIRDKISDREEFKDELNLLSSAYITTFDSFALSVVKKYHYLLGLSSDISICDESLVVLEENRIMDEIFDELYSSNDEKFKEFIKFYCVKSDRYLRSMVLKIAKILNNKINKYEVIDFIKNEFFSDDYVNRIVYEYKKFINNKKRLLELELENLKYYFNSEVVDKFHESLNGILNCDVNDLHLYSSTTLPRIGRYPSDESRVAKENVAKSLKKILEYCDYGSLDDIKYSITANKDIVEVIARIIEKFINKLKDYKLKNNIYTFSDIAEYSIKILKENEFARNDYKYYFKEIMIDEYQDTNDVQDIFINLIENNNVYMVGDIKQSIYKFRGSNPDIFKSKYDNYSNKNGGIKIDLIKNFRSREEVVKNINDIFELLMDSEIGGASYKVSHEMVFGKKEYETEKLNDFKYDMNILEYENDKDSGYSNSEVEIFTIANDIKNKVKNKIKVFDKKTDKLRDVTYNDFVIILDRSRYFDDYKKIFEYLGIPLTILQDENLNNSSDILLIKNIIDFIIRINNSDFDVEFKYDFMSIARSFLYEYSDEYIFDCIMNDKVKDSELYKTFEGININSITAPELFDLIINITNYYEKISRVGDYKNVNVRIKTLYDISNNLNNIGLTIEEFRDYLDEINENKIDIKYTGYSSPSDSVKIMTVHKSKGLEYPICYYSDIDHKFNVSDSNDMFIVSSVYGLIVPNVLSENDTSILKKLFKNDYMKEEIGEKIRLFYVALTRAREKIVIVIPKKEIVKLEKNEDGVIEENRRLNFSMYSDLIYSIKAYYPEYFSDVDINSLGLTKKYLFKKSISGEIGKTKDKFEVNEISVDNSIIEEKHFSKESNKLITKSESDNMKFGTKVHEVFELIDFKNYDENIIKDKFIRFKVTKFLNSDIMKNIKSANIYHEYEFIYDKDDISYHGIIDLMIEYDDHIDIIDYKLKNINDEKYLNQLNGYREYINSINNKEVNIYLYSILDETIQKL